MSDGECSNTHKFKFSNTGLNLRDFGFIATLSWHFILIVQPSDFFNRDEIGAGWIAMGLVFYFFFKVDKR